jgi:thymidylate synthase (FAD)
MDTPAPDDAPMRRPSVSTADAIIGKRVPVLDHGFVCLVDYMGDDAAIVQAARVSYGRGTKTVRTDRGLIRYLMRHRHTTPFEMVELKFLMRLPIFVARQIIRHRTANVNEYSARYSVLSDEFYIPPVHAIGAQSTENRQGRADGLAQGVAAEFAKRLNDHSRRSYELYEWATTQNVTRELARLALPVNVYTEWYWKNDLHNVFNFLALRLDPHAQAETRAYASVVYDAVKVVAPIAVEAFDDFTLGAISLSAKEQDAIGKLARGETFDAACQAAGIEPRTPSGAASGEAKEFAAKLEKIPGLLRGS